jgi:hypothetical protein
MEPRFGQDFGHVRVHADARAADSAFAVNALTGVLLFIADATRKSGQPIFFVKLGCIVLALVVTRRARSMVAGSAAPGDASQKIVAIVSLVLWLGAIAAGRLMAYL